MYDQIMLLIGVFLGAGICCLVFGMLCARPRAFGPRAADLKRYPVGMNHLWAVDGSLYRLREGVNPFLYIRAPGMPMAEWEKLVLEGIAKGDLQRSY